MPALCGYLENITNAAKLRTHWIPSRAGDAMEHLSDDDMFNKKRGAKYAPLHNF